MPEQPLRCNLQIADEILPGRSHPIAWVELTNLSEGAISFTHSGHPFQYLDLVLKRLDGSIVETQLRYGLMLVRPTIPQQLHTLQPGDRLKAQVGLLSHVELDALEPGTYTAQAIFNLGDIAARSETLPFRYSPGLPAQ